jgi:hypothetical protein
MPAARGGAVPKLSTRLNPGKTIKYEQQEHRQQVEVQSEPLPQAPLRQYHRLQHWIEAA